MPPSGDTDRALADFEQAAKFAPQNSIAYYNRGLAYRDKHEIDRAIANFDEAIKNNPSYAAAYYNRGNALEFKTRL